MNKIEIPQRLINKNPLWLELTEEELKKAKAGIENPADKYSKNGWELEEEDGAIILSLYDEIGRFEFAKIIREKDIKGKNENI